jgi:hypothetical protein
LVPLVLGANNLGQWDFDAAGRQLPVAAPCPFVGIGDKKKFTIRLGKDNGTLVPTFAN